MRPFAFVMLAALPISLAAQDTETWDVTLPRGETREIDFTTDEGTWMSLDVSPDGEWIVFDLLGHVYRMPASGGAAELLTRESGVSVNYHPRYSPDGRQIAFVSDRQGQNNLYVMDADGSNPRAVFTDGDVRVATPAWSADGSYVIVQRQGLGAPGRQGSNTISMYHVDGGQGIELIDVNGAQWPTVSRDGRYVYFHHSTGGAPIGRADALSGFRQLARFDIRTGDVVPVTSGTAQQQIRGSSGGAYAPEVSPDGRWLAFARRIPDGTISFNGHRYGPRTALWLRDLRTGAERVVMDPIEVDMTETIKTLRVLPGYAWTPDGEAIVISQGGQIRRLHVATGAVETIPFTARVHRVVSEQTRASFRIGDGPFDARFLRWYAASPDGRRLAFQAVGRIWLMDLPDGTPRRLTPGDFGPHEYAPAWSPDGRWIAFTSWDEPDVGHVWKVPAGGGAPRQLTAEPGEYVHPVWLPDGSALVAARGAGATMRGRTWVWNPWHDLVRVPADGGEAAFIAKESTPDGDFFGTARRQILRASMGPEGRVFYPEMRRENDDNVTALVSVDGAGGDKRVHATFPWADEVVVSPDGRRIAFQEGDNVYLMPFPWAGTGGDPVHVNKGRGTLPIEQLTTEGGLYPTWVDDTTLTYGNATRFFRYDVAAETADTFDIRLSVPRATPEGTVALANARIVTLDDRQVIERGTLIVEGSRIACVGTCDAARADRVMDLAGATIIPGFVDMHAHHYREHRGIIPRHSFEQAVYLAYGVTTNLDNSMWSQNVFPTAELIEAGEVIGPRTYSTGDPLYRNDGGRQNDLSSFDVADQNVARLASWGATSVKQYLQPRRDQRQWVAEAARARSLAVTSEGGDLAYNLGMIMDGQTAWEHPLSYVMTYGDVAKFFGRAKAVYSPTYVVGGTGPWNEEYFFQDEDLWRDEKLRRFTPWRQLVPHTRRRIVRPETDYGYPFIARTLATIVAEGGYGAIGSHGQQHGIASHWEVWMTASAMGPMGALEVASLHGAYFLGAERDIGSIEVGKLADLIVLDANPLDDIRNTRDIRYVMKGGRLWDGDTLDQIWPEAVPFGPYYWVDEDALRDDDRPVRR